MNDDVWGAALRYCFDEPGRAHVEIVESSDGGRTIRDLRRLFDPPEAWPDLHRRAVDLTRGATLDVGCAAGRHCLELQNRGQHVIGLDISPGALEVAAERGVAHVFLGTMSDFISTGTLVDTILLLEHNLAYFASDLPGFLEVAAQITSDDGTIVADGIDIHALPLTPRRAAQRNGPTDDEPIVPIAIRTRHDVGCTSWTDCAFISSEQVRTAAAGSGWSLTHLDSIGAEYLAVLSKSPPNVPESSE